MFFTLSVSVCAQNIMPAGARLMGMGNASVVVPDVFSVYSNPATLTGLKNETGFYADRRYQLAGLGSVALAHVQALRSTRLAGGIFRYGDELLSQSRMDVAIAHKIRKVSLGGGAGYHQLYVAENGTAHNVLLHFGGMAEITRKLSYGAHVFNLLRGRVNKESDFYYPVVMKTGISYYPVPKALLVLEVEKTSLLDPNLKAGMEYAVIERFLVRTGFNTSPSNAYAGIGCSFARWRFDYAVSLHSKLGAVHAVGIVLTAGKEKIEIEATGK